MNIKVNTHISSEYLDIQIDIKAPVLNDETKMIIDAISNMPSHNQTIAAEANNNIYILSINKIYCFFSDEKYNYCLTKDGTYRIRSTLYELEQNLDNNNWIRISNSCIINLNHVRCFDMGTVGSIVVILENGVRKDVAKRKIKEIMNLLKKRRELK